MFYMENNCLHGESINRIFMNRNGPLYNSSTTKEILRKKAALIGNITLSAFYDRKNKT